MQLGHDRLFGPEPGRRNPSFNLFQGSLLGGEAPLDGAFLHLPPTSPVSKAPPSPPPDLKIPVPEAPVPPPAAPAPPPPAPPLEWTVHTIDLASSFGDFNLTGFSFGSPDGDFALFDHIWLGRTLADLEGRHLLKTAPRKAPACLLYTSDAADE